MNKIIPTYSIGKYFKKVFSHSVSKADSVIAEKAATNAEEPVRVMSKQIEAYYARYGKFSKTPKKETKQTVSQQKKPSVINKMIKEECDAYNNIRYINVSKEALKGLEHNFEEKKNKVIELIMSNPQNLPKDYLHRVQQIKTPEHLSYIIRSYVDIANQVLNNKYQNVFQGVMKKQKISLKTHQNIFNEATDISNTYAELVKAVTEQSVDPQVVKIENYIKTKYNMNYVHLDNMEDAQRILQTINIAIKNDIPLPKQIIVSPFTMFNTKGVNIAHNFSERTIVLQKQEDIKDARERAYQQFVLPQSRAIAQNLKAQDARWDSTDDEMHACMHEFCHNKFYMELLIPMRCKPVPTKYNNTAQRVSIQASTAREELAAELEAKSLLRSLNKDEKELLAYFE